MNTITALLAGLVFGLGLLISGMANPAKVLGFLDLTGAWDPSLALVMGGAISVGLPGFWLARQRQSQRQRSLLGEPMRLPTSSQIDRRLVIGSLAFGSGWGLAGYCPGPAIVSMGMGQRPALILVAAMLAGMWLFETWQGRSMPRDPIKGAK